MDPPTTISVFVQDMTFVSAGRMLGQDVVYDQGAILLMYRLRVPVMSEVTEKHPPQALPPAPLFPIVQRQRKVVNKVPDRGIVRYDYKYSVVTIQFLQPAHSLGCKRDVMPKFNVVECIGRLSTS